MPNDGKAFEEYVASLLGAAGYDVVTRCERHSHEIDIEAVIDRRTIWVECKDHARAINWNDIAPFCSAASQAVRDDEISEAMVVSRSGFTQSCSGAAKPFVKDEVHLMRLEQLENYVLGLDEIRRHAADWAGKRRRQIPCFSENRLLLDLKTDASDGPGAASVLDSWLLDDASNLAVVFGEFGSGKTSTLLDFVRRADNTFGEGHWRTPVFLDYKDAVKSQARLLDYVADRFAKKHGESFRSAADSPQLLGHLLVILDGFDEVNLFGGTDLSKLSAEELRPDIRHLRSSLTPEAKVLISCRRSQTSSDDELLSQVHDQGRWPSLGVVHPCVVQLQPFDQSELEDALAALDKRHRVSVLEFFDNMPPELHTPLVLEMITGIDPSGAPPASINELYARFVSSALSRDFDQGRSRIPTKVKKEILSDVAGDIFERAWSDEASRGERGGLPPLPRDSVPIDRVQADVMKRVSEYETGLPAYDPRTFQRANWTSDFVQTSHLLDATRGEDGTESVRFGHTTFYEFFLAHHFLRLVREGRGEAVVLHGGHANEGMLDSLLIYFMKSMLSKRDKDDLCRLARRRGVSHYARALVIYLLEDEPDLEYVLQDMPEEYVGYLRDRERTIPTHSFAKKMFKYQLALLERDQHRAHEYVHFLRVNEMDPNLVLELSLFSVHDSPTEFLLRRWKNPVLEPVRPITAYRLGQFGDERGAVELRSSFEQGDLEPELATLVEEAIGAIRSRAEETVNA